MNLQFGLVKFHVGIHDKLEMAEVQTRYGYVKYMAADKHEYPEKCY